MYFLVVILNPDNFQQQYQHQPSNSPSHTPSGSPIQLIHSSPSQQPYHQHVNFPPPLLTTHHPSLASSSISSSPVLSPPSNIRTLQKTEVRLQINDSNTLTARPLQTHTHTHSCENVFLI